MLCYFQVYSKVIRIYIYTHIHVYILFQILLQYRLSQDIEYSPLCYRIPHILNDVTK